jgi:NAD-dependent deacetylase
LFITGAGLSAESGVPTYRGVGGLYNDGPTEHGMPIEQVLSGPMFERAPELTWQHIARIEATVRGAAPNAGHRVIAELERSHEVLVLTQNVDGLHRMAGSTRVIDIHGDCRQLLCTMCDHREARDSYEGLAIPPSCAECGAMMRPDVVLFEEMLPWHKVQWLQRELLQGFDAAFSVGTSSVFPYIVQPMIDTARAGRLTVEINPEETELSAYVEVAIRCGAGRALTAIAEQLRT